MEDFMQLYGETRGFSLGLPMQPTLLADGNTVLFLRAEAKKTSLSLFALDLKTQQTKCLLTPEILLGGSEGELSVEEKARRERLRLTTSGLVGFAVSDSGKWLLLPLAGRVFLYRLNDGTVLSPEAQGVIDPQLSPNDEQLAYVKDGDLYVWSLSTQAETRLTQASPNVTHGLAEYVAQEEMQRMRGYWWSPKGDAIAYTRVDNSALEQFFIADPMHPEKAPLHFRYPRAGKHNAEVRLFTTGIDKPAPREVVWDRATYPYLARAGWPASGPLYMLVQSREQRSEALLTADGATLLEEHDDKWINLDRVSPAWLRDGSGFLWMTEKSGEWQIEKRNVAGKLERTLCVPGLHELLRIDASTQTALALAADQETALQLFAVPLDGSAPTQLTHEVGERVVAFGRQSALFVETIATRERYRRVVVRRVSNGAEVCEVPRVNLEPPLTPNITWSTVGEHRAVVIKPRSFDANKRYPVVLSVYGGPHHNTILSQRESYLREQWLADQGFIVVASDNRGTPRRGRKWERAIAGDFSQVPLDDQVHTLQALGKVVPQMDLDRVGVYGWSFGGYMAALCALRRPDVFKRAVAGAPVVDWLDYDTHYTERYLGTPQNNPQGYERSSLLTYARDLTRPLLLIHGTADDNVYFFHTLKLSDALTRAGIAHEVLPLCGFTHMVPEPAMLSRLWGAIARHFEPLKAPA